MESCSYTDAWLACAQCNLAVVEEHFAQRSHSFALKAKLMPYRYFSIKFMRTSCSRTTMQKWPALQTIEQETLGIVAPLWVEGWARWRRKSDIAPEHPKISSTLDSNTTLDLRPKGYLPLVHLFFYQCKYWRLCAIAPFRNVFDTNNSDY